MNGNKGAVTITSGSKIINNGSTTNGGGIAVFSGNVTIDGSTISNNRADKDGGGIFNSDFSPGMITVTNSSMTQNTANSDGVAPGGDGGDIFHGAGSLTANFNRIVGNSADEGSGIAASDFPADARNNWWGCDDFPGADGCDTIKGTTDADPRLDLRLTAVPDTISVGDTSRLIADLTVNSDGTSIQPKLSVFNGLIVTFTGGTLGNLIPSSAIITDGMATTTFTAGAEGLTEVEATLDNRTERTAITIQSRADSAPPTLTVPSEITAEATGPSGAVVNYTVSASDNTDPSPTVVCTPHSGATFALGMTPVFCKATDASGNVAEASFDVRVVDTTPPMIKDFKVTPDDLWSPNHKLLPVSLTVSATDAMDRTPACQVVSVDTNELIIRPGSDKDEPDWEITGPLSLNLRLERSGQYAGRMYRITVECTDTAGNISGASAYVHVPHDQRDKEG